MADFNDNMQDISEQGVEGAKRQVTRALGNGTRRATNFLRKKISMKNVVNAAKKVISVITKLVQLIIKLLAAIGPIGWGILIFLAILFVILYEERGSNENNTLDPEYQNPVYVDEAGVTKAIAMTEPQAIIDAYYKFMSCSSYTKSYGGELLAFNDPEQTQDFAGLRDYNKIEENFYLSDDFIRSADEMLHNGDYFYPEQVIKPVFGQNLMLKNGKDGNGNDTSGSFYTARLPFDTPSGEYMLDEEHVKHFSDMISDPEDLKFGYSDDEKQVLAKSQVPQGPTEVDGNNYFELDEHRNPISDTSTATESGLWDYGFGSVLEYTPAQKTSYISCTYDKVDVDFDYRTYDEEEEEWSEYQHGKIVAMDISGSKDALEEKCQKICDDSSDDDTEWTYNLPSNIDAILDGDASWSMSGEPNSAAESNYASLYRGKRDTSIKNSHIDAEITDAWDADIDRLKFNNQKLTNDFGNDGGGLYPLKIAVCSHAATFSGNIHYVINGTTKLEESLSPNSTADKNHRHPVQTISVSGGCDSAELTAHRTGMLITEVPNVQEVTSPWGFEYIQAYAEHYYCYAPKDYINDREFTVRTGLNAPEDSDKEKEYKQNLEFLMNLGLLRLYSGNISLNAVGSVDMATLGDSESDLYILSHLIAAESGPNKLDELMVGSVFVNRVHSTLFPNTFKEVLTQGNGGQYACWADGNYRRAKPTEREIASAIQVMTGQFTVPENVLGQSADVQGNIYKTVVNGKGYNTHYYCAMPKGTAISTVDRYGRPAPDSSQLESLAASLSNETPASAGAAGSAIDFGTTAFIGDSLTSGLSASQGLAGKGASVISNPQATLSDLITMVESSSSLDSNTKTVYLLGGTYNSTANDSTFRSEYEELLEKIMEKAPSAQVVVTSLPPVVDGQSFTSNTYIDAKNSIIQNIASSKGYKILDINTPLKNGTQLDAKYSVDGTNLSSDGYGVWFSKLQAGLTSSSIGTDPSSAYALVDQNGLDIYSRYKLYDISEFDVLTATNMQARVVQAETGILATLKLLANRVADFIVTTWEGFKEYFGELLGAVSGAIIGDKGNRDYTLCYFYGAPYNGHDVKSVIYHSITFATQSIFSTAESVADEKASTEEGLTFLFVGKISSLGLGTIKGSGMGTMVPGVGTTVEGMISPTGNYYAPLTNYNPSTGYMEVSTPNGTSVLAVADGTIQEVGTNPSDARGQYVIQDAVIDGHTYAITYGYLNNISVTQGSAVSKGDQIGISGKRTDGKAGMYLSVRKDGVLVDPSTIFYQSTMSGASVGLGGDLYNPDGSVNAEKIQTLENALFSMVNSGGDMYHNEPLNGLEKLQCTWWAYGRGLEYLMTTGSPVPKSRYDKLKGHGGQYAGNNAAHKVFQYGSEPRANSLVCYPGSPYGHVAYVEAVDYVNKYYYTSEAGSGKAFYGIKKRSFSYKMSKYGTAGIFIYLDQPL